MALRRDWSVTTSVAVTMLTIPVGMPAMSGLNVRREHREDQRQHRKDHCLDEAEQKFHEHEWNCNNRPIHHRHQHLSAEDVSEQPH